MKLSATRIWSDGGLTVILGAVLFRLLGSDYHASPLALEWTELLLVMLVPALLSVVVVRARRGIVAADRVAARLALLVVTLVLLAFAAEFATRFALRNVTTSSDVRSYFSRRWGHTVAIRQNRLGFRERDFPMQKPPGVYRIAVIGDSFIYGNGAAEPDRLTNLLDKACAPRGCEVLNFGLPGASTPDNTATLRDVVLKIQPDVVLLAWFTNDPEATPWPDRPPHALPLLPWRVIEADLYGSSAFFALLRIEWWEVQFSLRSKDEYVEYMRKRFEDSNGPDAREADAELRKFIRMCKDHHLGVEIVLWPHLALDLGPSYPFAFLHEHVLTTCADEAIPCVDLWPVLGSAGGTRRALWSSPLDSHPGRKANELAAKKILEVFGPLWSNTAARAQGGQNF